MSDRKITIKEFEQLASVFNKRKKVRNVHDIIINPYYYDLVTTEFDDYFTLSVESSSLEAIIAIREYLIKEKVYVLTSVDNFGSEKLGTTLDSLNFKRPIAELGETIDILFGEQDYPEIRQSQEGFYFLIVPLSEKAHNFYEFVQLYLEKIEGIAVRHKASIYFEAEQLDGHLKGGLHLDDGRGNKKFEINVYVDCSNVRTMYISAAMIYRVSDNQEEFDKCGATLLFDDERPFAKDIEEKNNLKDKKPSKDAINVRKRN